MGQLDGKTALVTGASRGIGKAIAIELAREGSKVAVNYQHNEERAREVADTIRGLGGTCLLAKANLGDSHEAREMVARVAHEFGDLDILVNNAGITRDKMLARMTDDDWHEVIQTNLTSVFYCTSAAIPIMTAQSYGRIVNISSVNGQTGSIGQANYSASKGGIIAFTRTAALELARSNITVNAIAPGFTETEMVAKVPAHVQAQIHGRIPLNRFAQPEEIARAVIFLVAQGDYITGAQINVNGGLFMQETPVSAGASRADENEADMSENNHDFNPLDPLGVMKDLRSSGMDAWSKMMIEFVNTEAYSRATGATLDAWLSSSEPFRKALESAMTQALSSLNLPTRADVVSLAERLTHIELRLDDLEAAFDELRRETSRPAQPTAPRKRQGRKGEPTT